MYWPISAPITFCGQQQDSRACVKIVVENTQLCCSLFYCHSNKQHIISCHIFLGGRIHAKTIQFDEHKSTSLMRTPIWNRMMRVGNFAEFKTLSGKTAKIPSKANNFQVVFISCHTLKVLKGVSFTSILLWIINGQVIRHSTHLSWQGLTHWTVYGS